MAMNVDPRDTVDTPATDPNRGMRTQPYMLIVAITLVVLLIVALVFVIARRSTGSFNAAPPHATTGRLAAPHALRRSTLPRHLLRLA